MAWQYQDPQIAVAIEKKKQMDLCCWNIFNAQVNVLMQLEREGLLSNVKEWGGLVFIETLTLH